MVNRLFAWLDRRLTAAQIRKISADIDHEVRYHARHAERMKAYFAEIARLRAHIRPSTTRPARLQPWLSMSPTGARELPARVRFISQRTARTGPKAIAGTDA